jgi:dipeptidyl aminopeptidase/acylaminoacyl peptidase
MTEPWELRFTAPQIAEVRWTPRAPDRLGVVTTESGRSQAWTWDLLTGERRQASDDGVGAEEVHVTPDGEGVVWWLDPLGDERGRWMVTPFAGGHPYPLLPDVPDGWMSGLSMVSGVIAAGFSGEDDYVVYLAREGAAVEVRYRHQQPAGVGLEWPQGPGGLSADGSLLCLRHAEDGDISHMALRVLDASSGAPVGDLRDEGLNLAPAGWSPVPGDQRLIVIREVDGIERPWCWDLQGSTLEPLTADVPGALFLADWYPDASALLLRQDHKARDALIRFDLSDRSISVVVPAEGTISQASIRPDGHLWYRSESGARAPRLLNGAGEEVLRIPDVPRSPGGRPCEEVWFDNPHGDRIQGWLKRPEGAGPYPTIVSVHGGPEHHDTDAFDPREQAYVDHGFAVLSVNYRGSTGYGTTFREAIHGDIGFPESEDLNAGVDHLVTEGLADPDRLFIEGWSWGGYLATLNAGLNPDRWRAVLAGIPVGDYVAAHYECAPALRAWDLATLGGSPMDLPELYRERNPMTYVGQVKAPMLMIAGKHDSRCPLGQVMTYAHALRARGREVEVHLYASGHHANDVAEQIAHVRLAMDFFTRHLDGATAS